VSESLKDNYRVKFNSDAIRDKWWSSVKEVVGVKQIAVLCKCSERTVRDWCRGKVSCSYKQLKIISKYSSIIPLSFTLISKAELNRLAGKKGGKAIIKKYGKVPVAENYRKEKWFKWWQEEGYSKPLPSPRKEINHPKKSKILAEFIGVMIGDGSISNYQISVTLNSEDDIEYIEHVIGLIKKLFSVEAGVYKKKNAKAVNIVVSRKNLVDSLIGLGLPKGDKLANEITIPDWIVISPALRRACMRGMFDTDGTVYKHSYKSKGKNYSYTKIGFSSASVPLRKQVAGLLQKDGIAVTQNGTNLAIESRTGVEVFKKKIGFSNKKHLKRLVK
jgi:intein/homing endonuclease